MDITEDSDWSGFVSGLPLPIEHTLLLLIDYGQYLINMTYSGRARDVGGLHLNRTSAHYYIWFDLTSYDPET